MVDGGPVVTRPGYVSLIPGGPQEFPVDPKGEQYRTNLARLIARQTDGRRTIRRIPCKEDA